MRILLISTLYPPDSLGGAELSTHELAIGLRQLGHDVSVVSLAQSKQRVRKTVQDDIPVYRFPSNALINAGSASIPAKLYKAVWHLREWYRPSALAFLVHVVRTETPQVIHIQSAAGFGLATWLVASCYPSVYTIRDYYTVCINSRTYRRGRSCTTQCLQCSWARRPFRLALRSNDAVVGISHAVLRRVGYFGVNLSQTTQALVIANRPTIPSVPSRFSNSVISFGFIGRIDDYKGIFVVARAFQDVTIPARLVVAGTGNDDSIARLEKIRAADSRIVYIGRVQPEYFYAQVDVVLVPSQWEEPFGRVPAEAALAGCAVIVSNVGGLPEAIAPESPSLLVDSFGDATAWTSAMLLLSSYRRHPLTHEVPRPCPESAYAALYADILSSETILSTSGRRRLWRVLLATTFASRRALRQRLARDGG